ncbi:peptidoglycan-binding domain-containing protein [Palleronia caenipelagi]|nr:peptidoglycan-binding domain-containing protein [Palleronia caenipelagi]
MKIKFLVLLTYLFSTIGLTSQAEAQAGWMLPGGDVVATPQNSTGWLLPTSPARAWLPDGSEVVRPSDRALQPLFRPGAVVVTGFSGTRMRAPKIDPDQPERDREDPRYRFIDLDGISAGLLDPTQTPTAYDGSELRRRPYDRLLARDVGQVFGAALDLDETPGLYLSAGSSFGLPIIGDDADDDGVPDRLFRGAEGAEWMPGLWGADLEAGPGTVWRVDGGTGQVRVFANIRHDELDNSGAALGGIAHDATHDQIFVSDLDFGTIHRINAAGIEQEVYDHGLTALPLVGRTAVADDEVQAERESPLFDPGNPDSWGVTQTARRVRGLEVRGGRLWYSVASGATEAPEIWSIGIDKETGELGTPRFEVAVTKTEPESKVFDVDFGPDGQMLVSTRPPVFAEFEMENFVPDQMSDVLRYTAEYPEDTTTPELWEPVAAPYQIGFAREGRNALGGLALGPELDEEGQLVPRTCRETLWASGELLRNQPSLRRELEPGGALPVDGVQFQPYPFDALKNTPPWTALFYDYDGSYPEELRLGRVGDVEVVGCNGDGEIFGGDDISDWESSCVGPDCVCDTSGKCYCAGPNCTQCQGAGCDKICVGDDCDPNPVCTPDDPDCDKDTYLEVTKSCVAVEDNYNGDDDALCTVNVQYRGPAPTASNPLVLDDGLTSPTSGWEITGTVAPLNNWDCNAPVSAPANMTCKIWDAREPSANWSNFTSSYQYYVTAGDEFVNCVSGAAGGSSDRACFHFGSKADLEIVKTAETEFCEAGKPCYFNITVRNIGTGPYIGALNINDSMVVDYGSKSPGKFTAITADICGNINNLTSQAGCSENATILPGGQRSYRVTWFPAPGQGYDANGTPAENCVNLRDALPPGGQGQKRACAPVKIKETDLEISKVIDGECLAGQECTFEITITAGADPIAGRYAFTELFSGGPVTSISATNPVLPGQCLPDLSSPCVLDVNIPANTSETVTVTAQMGDGVTEGKNCVYLLRVADDEVLGPVDLSDPNNPLNKYGMLPADEITKSCISWEAAPEIELAKRCQWVPNDILGQPVSFKCAIEVSHSGPQLTSPITITDFIQNATSGTIGSLTSDNATCTTSPATGCTITPADFAAAGDMVRIDVLMSFPPTEPNLAEVKNCVNPGDQPDADKALCVPISYPVDPELEIEKDCGEAVAQDDGTYFAACNIIVRGSDMPLIGTVEIRDFATNLGVGSSVSLTPRPSPPVTCDAPTPGAAPDVLCRMSSDALALAGGEVTIPVDMTFSGTGDGADWENCASSGLYQPIVPSGGLALVEKGPEDCDRITIVGTPELPEVTKSCDPATPTSTGWDLQCSITVEEQGLDPNGNTTVTDLLKAQTSNPQASFSGPSGSPVNCTPLPTLAGLGMECTVENRVIDPQLGYTIPISVTIPGAGEDLGDWKNCAIVDGKSETEYCEDLTMADDPVPDPTTISVRKICQTPVDTGSDWRVDCDITVTGANLPSGGKTGVEDSFGAGTSATGVTLSVPPGPPYNCANWPASSGPGANCQIDNDFITQNNDRLPISVTMNVPYGTTDQTVVNCGNASVVAPNNGLGDILSWDAAPDCERVTIPATVPVVDPELTIRKTCDIPREGPAGFAVDCLLTVTGSGLPAGDEIRFNDVASNLLADPALTVSSPAAAPVQCQSLNASGLDCTMPVSHLVANGGTVVVPVTVTYSDLVDGTEWQNCASALAQDPGGQSLVPTAIAPQSCEIIPHSLPELPVIDVTKTCGAPVRQFEEYVVACTVTVTGSNLTPGGTIALMEQTGITNTEPGGSISPDTGSVSYCMGSAVYQNNQWVQPCDVPTDAVIAGGGSLTLNFDVGYPATEEPQQRQNCVTTTLDTMTAGDCADIDLPPREDPGEPELGIKKMCAEPVETETGWEVSCTLTVQGQALPAGETITLTELSDIVPGAGTLAMSVLPDGVICAPAADVDGLLSATCTFATDTLTAAGGALDLTSTLTFPPNADPKEHENCVSAARGQPALGAWGGPADEVKSCVDFTVPASENIIVTPVSSGLALEKASTGACEVNKSAQTYRCGFEISVTNTDDAPYTGPLVLDDQFGSPEPRDAKVTGGDLECTPAGGGGVSCLTGNVALAPGQSTSVAMDLTIPGLRQGGSFENCVAQGFGDSSFQQVTIVQSAMQLMGIDGGPVDGLPGKQTAAGVSELQERLGLVPTGEVSPELLEKLGLQSSSAAEPVCVSVDLPPMPRPPLVCDAATAVLKNGACACRFRNMYERNKTSCGCVKGYDFKAGQGCVKRKSGGGTTSGGLRCEKGTTVKRGSSCVCRYKGMVQISKTSCGCTKGYSFQSGRGCVKVVREQPKCPAGTANIGGVCVKFNINIDRKKKECVDRNEDGSCAAWR